MDSPTDQPTQTLPGALVPANYPGPEAFSSSFPPVPSPAARQVGRRRALFVVIAVILAVVAVIFAITSFFSSGVQATGVVEPVSTVQLNFATAGPITSLWVLPGQHVHKGEVLATQNATVLAAKLASDEAKLYADNVALFDPTPNQSAQQLADQVSQAQAAESDAQTKSDSQAAIDGTAVTAATSALQSANATLSTDEESTSSACSPGAQGSTAACDAAQHTLSVDRANVAADQDALNTAEQTQRSDAANGQSNVAQSQAAVTTAEANQTQGAQTQTQSEQAQLGAQVSADKATIAADKISIAQAQILAPFAGTVASVNASTGDLAGPNGVKQQTSAPGIFQQSSGITIFPQAPSSSGSQQTQTASLMTVESRAIRVLVQVPESTIGQVRLGQHASVTLPAVPGATYTTKVLDIQPTAVTQAGKVYFLVDLLFIRSSSHGTSGPTKLDQLSGLTADVTFN